nr:pheromone 5 [Grifola frondosa]
MDCFTSFESLLQSDETEVDGCLPPASCPIDFEHSSTSGATGHFFCIIA